MCGQPKHGKGLGLLRCIDSFGAKSTAVSVAVDFPLPVERTIRSVVISAASHAARRAHLAPIRQATASAN